MVLLAADVSTTVPPAQLSGMDELLGAAGAVEDELRAEYDLRLNERAWIVSG
jgi:hypothetical protein